MATIAQAGARNSHAARRCRRTAGDGRRAGNAVVDGPRGAGAVPAGGVDVIGLDTASLLNGHG
ncbi:hypothetical protein, partial [Burkholderia cenocepacia]|uniref:hypothetical protein n=1 Tax=Burkholderia cenocepacia TaxID=95486 RepID=UPI001EFA0A92